MLQKGFITGAATGATVAITGAVVGGTGAKAGAAVGSLGQPQTPVANDWARAQISRVVPSSAKTCASWQVKEDPASVTIMASGLPRVGSVMGKAFLQILHGIIGAVGGMVGSVVQEKKQIWSWSNTVSGIFQVVIMK